MPSKFHWLETVSSFDALYSCRFVIGYDTYKVRLNTEVAKILSVLEENRDLLLVWENI